MVPQTPGVLITSNEGHFASFKCSFAGAVEVRGNGIVGTITEPEEGVASNTAHISFSETSAKSGVQTHQTVVGGEENPYHLESSFNGGAFEESAEEVLGTMTFAENMKPTLRTE